MKFSFRDIELFTRPTTDVFFTVIHIVNPYNLITYEGVQNFATLPYIQPVYVLETRKEHGDTRDVWT